MANAIGTRRGSSVAGRKGDAPSDPKRDGDPLGVRLGNDFAGAAGNALSIAGATLGLAGNALAFAQAACQGAGATNRWSTLSGAAEKIESLRGKVWYDRIKNRTKWKTALQGLELAAAGLGIVAGRPTRRSRPGWSTPSTAAGRRRATRSVTGL